jgi:hypothetical protein
MTEKLFNLQVRPIFYDGELGRLMWIVKNGNNLAEGTIYCQQKDAAKLTQPEIDNFVETYRLYYKIEQILETH